MLNNKIKFGTSIIIDIILIASLMSFIVLSSNHVSTLLSSEVLLFGFGEVVLILIFIISLCSYIAYHYLKLIKNNN